MTPCKAMIGVPNAPKATGAVFAISESPEAWSGENPRAISKPPVTATGVPKPAAPSTKAPKLKAIRRSWSRRSSVSDAMLFRSTSKSPRPSASR